jgi:predicted alpha/beta-hydrolase family hydrolase
LHGTSRVFGGVIRLSIPAAATRSKPDMRGHCILCHGFESGPDATKVTALADVAERRGWTHQRPDFTDLDAMRDKGPLGDVAARVERLLALAREASVAGPLVLAGSSLGAWIAGHVSLQVPVAGLSLLAPPIALNAAHPLRAADVQTSIVHGWHDELIPAADVVDWARVRGARLLLVDDSHRLSSHVQASANAFEALLTDLSP